MNQTNNKSNILSDLIPLFTGELLVVLIVVLTGLGLSYGGIISFGAEIPLGALLGALVTIANYAVLIISLDKAVRDYLALRGENEMSDEEAESFAKAHTASVQKTISRSTVLRTASIVGCLLVAFLTGIFNPIATIIPLLAYRPILTVAELIKAKNSPAPNPEKYINYEYKDENEEKESD